MIKDDDVFNGPRSCKQLPIRIQLAVVLYRLGSCGEGATITKIGSLFGISDGGVIQVMTNRVFDAILKKKNNFLYWPDPIERRALVVETLKNDHNIDVDEDSVNDDREADEPGDQNLPTIEGVSKRLTLLSLMET
ncbi:PREDICTED: uncharacterized protein LOC108374204 [Rhagoletis zephyria]|uniref:uncharacterized protein LOC108374204 n=1 Tax=Rhagoletis zephyria TaxID=28612 RepID=UPI0008113B67|nr:PREDICTED: uncharacterized protein LOC108374204 [Rhagoletis zephyria]